MKSVFILFLLLFSARMGWAEERGRRAEEPAQQPHSLIYMIGDGMGLAHVAMLMIEGGYAETAFDRAENVALITTYSANNRVTDSAAAGTALATGEKTNNGTLGKRSDGEPVESLITRALKRGMKGGVVATCELQHATPGAFYAHVDFRGDYTTISHQLAQSGLEVALGGGLKPLQESGAVELLEANGYTVLQDFADLEHFNAGRVVGAFAEGHLPSKLQGRGDFLPRATEKALELLDEASRKRGFVLMVEGSQIDFESHANSPSGILAEMRDFEQAVCVAMEYVDRHPGTLLVITADHETGGLSMPSGNSDFTLSESGIEYRFGTGSHTGVPVPVYLYGTGACEVNGVMDNTELSARLAELLGL